MRHEGIELDACLPRFLREELDELAGAGVLTVDRVRLADADVEDPWISFEIDRRWNAHSPLRRAAHAALAHLEARDVDLYAVHLHGKTIEDRVTPHFVGFQLRYVKSALYCFRDHHGTEWLEVVRPTLREPLHALRLRPGKRFDLYGTDARTTAFFT